MLVGDQNSNPASLSGLTSVNHLIPCFNLGQITDLLVQTQSGEEMREEKGMREGEEWHMRGRLEDKQGTEQKRKYSTNKLGIRI